MKRAKVIALMGAMAMVMSVLVGGKAQGYVPPPPPTDFQHTVIQNQMTTEHGDVQYKLTHQHSMIEADLDDLSTAIQAVQDAVDALKPGYAAPPCGAGTAGQRFVVSPNSTEVCDNTTGLKWEQNPDSITRSHADALAHCPTLGPGFRLPEVKELSSLVDYTQSFPPLSAGHPFTNIQASGGGCCNYWSATTSTNADNQAWFVLFEFGSLGFFDKTSAVNVWCVSPLALVNSEQPDEESSPSGEHEYPVEEYPVEPAYPVEEYPVEHAY